MKEALNLVLNGESLSRKQASDTMDFVSKDTAVPEQTAALLAALRCKSETVDEIVGFVESLRQAAISIEVSQKDAIDICGTGGDGTGTFNVSTTAAFVIAACGQPVAKHGNRSVSSRSGSTDVLDALGIDCATDPVTVRRQLDDYGLSFMSAPAFHPTLRKLAPLRRNLGVHTVFNILGPLLNPVCVRRQVIGVFNSSLPKKISEVLKELGSVEAIVVHGRAGGKGLDEFSVSGVNHFVHLKDRKLKRCSLHPEDCGLKSAPLELLLGGSPEENAKITLDILRGIKGPKRDLVLINVAAALVVAGKAEDFKQGIEMGSTAIDSERAYKLLSRMQEGK